ncbi:MAG TPA: hypothetical protein VJI33_04985 [Candidatus Paceibacterota bacterium]
MIFLVIFVICYFAQIIIWPLNLVLYKFHLQDEFNAAYPPTIARDGTI